METSTDNSDLIPTNDNEIPVDDNLIPMEDENQQEHIVNNLNHVSKTQSKIDHLKWNTLSHSSDMQINTTITGLDSNPLASFTQSSPNNLVIIHSPNINMPRISLTL